MAALQRPPIPQAPLVDQNGYVSREWWRWFASVGVVVAEQAGSISTVTTTINDLTVVTQAEPPPDPPNLEQAAQQALQLAVPRDPVPADQLMMLAQLLAIPVDSGNQVGPVTVAKLLPAAQAGVGARAFVTDATATTFASVVAGTGGNKVPVYSDGTNWRIG